MTPEQHRHHVRAARFEWAVGTALLLLGLGAFALGVYLAALVTDWVTP